MYCKLYNGKPRSSLSLSQFHKSKLMHLSDQTLSQSGDPSATAQSDKYLAYVQLDPTTHMYLTNENEIPSFHERIINSILGSWHFLRITTLIFLYQYPQLNRGSHAWPVGHSPVGLSTIATGTVSWGKNL